LGTINIAAREKLDNLILVINCNLQRLDGPVRGNGKIIQELERVFRGADWNVLKVIWGSGWDALLASDKNGVLRKRMDDCLDGDYQMYSVLPGDVQREHWVEGNPELEQMMNSLTDEEVKAIKRGGQDRKKVYAAFDQAMQARDKPTVLLVKTVKGDGMGAQGKNTAHQYKNMSGEERVLLAKELGIPLSSVEAAKAEFYMPPEDSAEIRYLRKHRTSLGGPVPRRRQICPSLEAPNLDQLRDFLGGSRERSISSTMVMVRLLSSLLRLPEFGKYVVPIVPDEARTFGMDGLFKVAGIYSPLGQQYRPVDADSLVPYREAADGQILQEGICETGAMASFMAAGSAYAVHGLPMIPFYIFYSMFGFQRVGDMIWSCGDMMCRGFLLGGTAGRTTLNGEGLQHEDGHSQILASTVPNLKSYDPYCGYELTVIVRDGLYRMYELQEDHFYYLTLYNEAFVMPDLATVAARTDQDEDSLCEGILQGIYRFDAWTSERSIGQVNLLASGPIVRQAQAAADFLIRHAIDVTLWSVTSFTELERDAQRCAQTNRENPFAQATSPYIARALSETDGVYVAVTDYMKKIAVGLAPWIPGSYEVLGTDGYGLSESREKLREYFEIDAKAICKTALASLYRDEQIDGQVLQNILNDLDVI
ncbi:MAG: pyruvate dehydrogenase (acetyl-transferring), homodimeric type, partial [Pseudomonadales bacterium]|nr:pyruvate dehydrogenase (acetyl-transferring), homodimeric type [Pseudomonadales bacterium]